GNDPVSTVNTSVTLVIQFRIALTLAHHRSVRIGRGREALIDPVTARRAVGWILFWFLLLIPLFQTSLKLSVRWTQIPLKALSIDHRIARSIGFDQARITKKFPPID